MMGSAAVFVDCDESWKLLLVTRRGLLYVWDLFNRTCILHESLSSLVTSREDSSAKDAGKNFELYDSDYKIGNIQGIMMFVRSLSLICFISLIRYNKNYICKIFKIWFTLGCSCHASCLSVWHEPDVLAKDSWWLLPSFKLFKFF